MNALAKVVSLHDLYLLDLQDDKQAMIVNKRLLDIIPSHPVGNFNQGASLFREASHLPDPEAQKQKLAQAIVAYTKSLASDSLFVQARYNRGYCYFLVQNENPAIKDLQKVIELDPKNHQAYFLLGSIYEHFQDKKSALENYQKAVASKPDFADAIEAVVELSK